MMRPVAFWCIVFWFVFLRVCVCVLRVYYSPCWDWVWGGRRHRVVVEDRSVAPVWPRWVAARQRSAGGRWWSWRSWSIQRLRGRPELRTQSRSGCLPSEEKLMFWSLISHLLPNSPEKFADLCQSRELYPGKSESEIFSVHLPLTTFLNASPRSWQESECVVSSVRICCCNRWTMARIQFAQMSERIEA